MLPSASWIWASLSKMLQAAIVPIVPPMHIVMMFFIVACSLHLEYMITGGRMQVFGKIFLSSDKLLLLGMMKAQSIGLVR